MNKRLFVSMVGTASVCWALMPSTLSAQAPASGSMDTARELVRAFNRHDARAMAALVTDDFELYYFGDDGHASLASRGPRQLEEEMLAYFAQRPTVRSEIAAGIDGTRFVALREQIVGGASSIAVYEIADGLVRRAWYYPAES